MKNHIHISELDWHTPLPNRLFLEASAGTGKTYTIQHFIVRSILESARRGTVLHPETLLVVTFTKAAAGELKMRIQETVDSAYQAILEMLQRIKGQLFLSSKDLFPFFFDKGFPYILFYLFTTDIEEISGLELDKRSWDLIYSLKRFLQEIDLAQISTIHSFLHTAIVQYCQEREGENAFDLNYLDNIMKSQWVTQFGLIEWIQECLTWSLPEGVIIPSEWSLLIRHYRGQTLAVEIAKDLLDEKIYERKAIKTSDPRAARKSAWEEIHKQFISYADVFSRGLDRVENWLKKKKGATKRDGTLKGEYLLAISQLIHALQCSEYSIQWYEEIVPCFEVLDPIVKSESKKRGSQESSQSERFVEELFFGPFWSALSALFSLSAIYHRIYAYISQLFIELLQKGEWKTFQSVLEVAYDLSKNGNSDLGISFSEYLQSQFQVVIIDEFQDTDPLQWAIFKTLFFDKSSLDRRILFVGDPKQAIYIFRNADVYAYLEAKASFQLHEIGSLNKNYRASIEMVSGLNGLFSEAQVDQWLFFMPKIGSSIGCERVEARASNIFPLSKTRNGASIHFAFDSAKRGRKRIWPPLDIEETSLFTWMRNEIWTLIDHESIALHEIAILVKDRHQAARLELFLRKNRLPSKTVRIDTIAESSIFPLFIALIHAIEDAPNPMRLSELFLASQTELGSHFSAKISSNIELQGEIFSNFFNIRKAFYRLGIGGMAHMLYHEPCISEKSILDIILTLFSPDIQNEIDFEHLLEIISKLHGFGYRTLSQIAEGLYHLQTLFIEDPEYLIRRTESEKSSLSIMTMHRSKGLEFPIVFALGAASRIKEVDNEKSTLEKEDIESEKIRLLYVAMTRAKRRLYLLGVIETLQKSAPLGSSSPLELFFACHRGNREKKMPPIQSDWRCEIETPITLEDITHVLSSFSTKEITFSMIQEDLKQYITSYSPPVKTCLEGINSQKMVDSHRYETKRYLSFSQLHKKKSSSSSDRTMKIKNGGKILGVRFHTAISRWFRSDRRAYNQPQNLSFLQKWIENEFPSWKKNSVELSKMLYTALSVAFPLGDEQISLQQLRVNPISEKIFLEESLEGINSSHASYFQGSIDLIFFHEKRMYMIDWKTNRVPVDTESLNKMVFNAGYHLQADLYSRVAKRYIKNNPNYSWGGFFLIFLAPIVEEREGLDLGFHFCPQEEGSVAFGLRLKKQEGFLLFLRGDSPQYFMEGVE